MARKLPVLQRVLGAPTLFSVAYGEIASSIYFALGIIAGHALGLTPEVLLLDGPALPRRRPVLRRGHHRHPGDGRRGHARAQGLQRLRRVLYGLGAVPRLPHRHHAVCALPAALPRWGARDRCAAEAPVGRRRRCGRDRRHRRRAPVPATRSLHGRNRRGSARPRHSGARRRARPRSALLSGRPDAGRRPRLGPELVGAGVRSPARDARVHGSGDGGQPRRGGASAGHRHPAQPVQRDRRRRGSLRRDRRGRALGVPRVRR